MAVYYKFKSAKYYESIPIEGRFISSGHLKQEIFERKNLAKGTDYDLVITNVQTNEEYLDEGTLIPKNTSVSIRRVPGLPHKTIVTAPVAEQEKSNICDNVQAINGSFVGADQSAMKSAEDSDWDDFGNDIYATPETVSVQSLSSTTDQDAPAVCKDDEESRIKALVETPALDWQCQLSHGFGPYKGFRHAMGGRTMGGRGFGRSGFYNKTPPQGHICRRCKMSGHFIHHCPTNGDPNFDIKRVKPPTGIPRSMLMATPDGSYTLPGGAVAVIKPNEAAFEKEMEGMPSTRKIGELPPELHCSLCKNMMKDAVFTSKCCFTSFCDKCIRDHIISRRVCVCGATNILADDLLPNKTLRDTIIRLLGSNNNSSAEKSQITYQSQGSDVESRNPRAKSPSPTQSAASKGQQMPALETVEAAKEPLKLEETSAQKVPDVLETVNGVALKGNAPLAVEEVQQKPISVEAGKKKKKKKICMSPGGAKMQWRTPQDLAPEYCTMPFGPSAFNPYWNCIQPGLDGFMPPPYHFNPFGAPTPMLPYGPPQREEFKAPKADLKRKCEMERCHHRSNKKSDRRECQHHDRSSHERWSEPPEGGVFASKCLRDRNEATATKKRKASSAKAQFCNLSRDHLYALAM